MKERLRNFLSNGLLNKSLKVLTLRIIGVCLFFSLTLFLTNFYDPKLVGEYDFIRSFIIFIGALVVLGMQQSILYYSGIFNAQKKAEEIKGIYFKMLFILLMNTILLSIIFKFFLLDYIDSFFNKNISESIIKVLITLFFYGLTILNTDVFRAINKLFFSEIFRNIFRHLFFFIGIVLLFFIEKQSKLIDAFLINFGILSVLSTIIILFYLSKFKRVNSINNLISYKDIIKRSLPMAISSIAFLLMQSVDLLLIGKFLEFEQVAYYAVTVKLTMIISLVLSSVNAIIAPKISEFFSSNQHQKLQLFLTQSTRIIFFLTIPAILLFFIFSDYILNFFGENYSSAKMALYIILIGQTVNSLCGSVGICMNMTGNQNMLQKILLTALILNIGLNWVLIPKFGINGAAIATSISMVFWNLAGVLYLSKKNNLKTYIH